MLKNRVITALILAPLVLCAVYFLDHLIFVAVIAFALGLAAYEWAGLCNWTSRPARMLYTAAFLGAALFLHLTPQLHLQVIYGGLGIWGGAILAVLLFPRGQALFRSPLLLAPLGLILLSVAWLCIARIHLMDQGSHWVVWALFLAWAADVGAYFAGKAFGQRKLAPHVSPGKTWEGALGGVILAMLVCGGVAVWWQGDALLWLGLTFCLVVISIFGDLFESLLKRSTGVKDSGTILPGHGGLLDRIDSLLAVLPALAAVLLVTKG